MKHYYGRLNFTHCALSFGMMIMMSGITKVFNKSAKRNFHQRESHDDDKIATIYYDILEQKKNEDEMKGKLSGTSYSGPIFVHSLWAKIAPLVTFVSVLEKFIYYSPQNSRVFMTNKHCEKKSFDRPTNYS